MPGRSCVVSRLPSLLQHGCIAVGFACAMVAARGEHCPMSLRLVCASCSCQRPCVIINLSRWPHDPPRWRRGPLTACRNVVRVRVPVWLCDCSRVLALPPQRDGSDAVRISVSSVRCADRDRRVGRRGDLGLRLRLALVDWWRLGARAANHYLQMIAPIWSSARVLRPDCTCDVRAGRRRSD